MENISLLKNRAWIEISLDSLENNIQEIQKILSENTRIMAVVKANAYGHGDLIITKKLMELGIEDFAVATIDEGIRLRKHKIKGNILILGFTNFEDLKYVIQYDLIQTIIDYDYSEKIKTMNLENKLKCHIKINTGMNRIGENYKDFKRLSAIYENKQLEILGTFSHLCVADSSDIKNIEFTKLQIKHFDSCIKKLKDKGYNLGKIHLQSSYGTVNYLNLSYDFVRMGILMYGVNSSLDSYNLKKLNLKPILALKTRISSIKEIRKNDSISYGRTYIAKGKRKVATLSIGYADGLPRNLSNKDLLVKVGVKYAPIIGRICMDQLVIDVTDIQDVKVGDIVSLIDIDEKISAEIMAAKSETITNELLSRLGNRLSRIVKEK